MDTAMMCVKQPMLFRLGLVLVGPFIVAYYLFFPSPPPPSSAQLYDSVPYKIECLSKSGFDYTKIRSIERDCSSPEAAEDCVEWQLLLRMGKPVLDKYQSCAVYANMSAHADRMQYYEKRRIAYLVKPIWCSAFFLLFMAYGAPFIWPILQRIAAWVKTGK